MGDSARRMVVAPVAAHAQSHVVNEQVRSAYNNVPGSIESVGQLRETYGWCHCPQTVLDGAPKLQIQATVVPRDFWASSAT